jgi:hypothetical protein
MKKQQLLFKWLAVAALVEWLLVRTITRAAIHIPKSAVVIKGYTAVNQIGLVAAAFVALLSMGLLLWIAWQMWQTGQTRLLPLVFGGLTLLSVLFLFVVPPAWLAFSYQFLAATAVILIVTMQLWGRDEVSGPVGKWQWQEAATRLFPAAALLAGLLYQLLPNLYILLKWPGPPPVTSTIFNLGELLVVASVGCWWWVYGRIRSWHVWIIAAIPALLFSLSFQRDPAMTGILTIWSTGLTLFLPWPVYAAALWLASTTILATWADNPPVAYAVLLFTSAGYAPQLSSQLFCALIGLWLMTYAAAVHTDAAYVRQAAAISPKEIFTG